MNQISHWMVEHLSAQELRIMRASFGSIQRVMIANPGFFPGEDQKFVSNQIMALDEAIGHPHKPELAEILTMESANE